MTFEEWIETGVREGFCGPPICEVHDGMPMSRQEHEAWNSGEDICLYMIRLYDDLEHKTSIERNYNPSRWRNPWKTGE